MDKKFNELQGYLNYEFSSGCDTGEDYKVFERKYLNYLKTICTKNGWELVNTGKNHYCFSAFVKDVKHNFVFLSIDDVRWSKDWYYNILIRKAEHSRDYKGGSNHFTSLSALPDKITYLLQGV